MNEQSSQQYPSISQSFGIMGIVILGIILFSPITFLLEDTLGKEVTFFIYYVFSVGVPFWVIHRIREKKTGIDTYTFLTENFLTILLILGAMLGLQIGVTLPIASSIPMPEAIYELFKEFGGQKGLFSFLSIVVAAPLLEEFIFRGVMLDGLLKRYSPTRSILISSFLFGLVHLNPWQFVSAFIIGLLAGWVYYKTRNLLLPILIHMVNNLFAYLQGIFMDTDNMMDESLTEMFGGTMNTIIAIGSAIALSAAFIYLLDKRFAGKEPASHSLN